VIALGQKEPENINRMIIIRHAFSIHTRVIFRHHSFGSKLGTKIVENSNLALLHVL
jgi:hypothetical protein